MYVTKSMFNKGVPIVLGSHQIKQIFDQARISRMDCWQQPWKFIYEGYVRGNWYKHKNTEELSNTDDSFEVVPYCCHGPPSCPAMLLEKLRSSTPTWEKQAKQVEKKIEQDNSTALKGIPGPL